MGLPRWSCPLLAWGLGSRVEGESDGFLGKRDEQEALVDNRCQSSPWLVHMIYKHVGVPVQWTFVAKINEKGECSFIIWNICEVYTFHSWIDIKDCPKDFSIDSILLVG
ncbi:hypothetical protein Tco_1261305 [Tanacetum coccineum]